MTETNLKRPHFRRPPIHEQAISLSFDAGGQFTSVDPGLFWTLVREEFPASEMAPRHNYPVETFEGGVAQFSFDLALMGPVKLPRTLFKNTHSGEVIQLQDNAFVFNWVRENEAAEYPRFERTSARLWELYGRFAEYMSAKGAREPAIRSCELTNVNVVPVDDFGRGFEDIGNAFKVDPFEWDVPGLVWYARRALR